MLNFLKIAGIAFGLSVAGQTVPAEAGEPSVGTVMTGRLEVLDGGHFRLRDTVIRLNGVLPITRHLRCQAGQGSWACGAWVAGEVSARYDGRDVVCIEMSRDSNGIVVASCLDGQSEIAADLVSAGLAFADFEGAFAPEARRARRVGTGVMALGVLGVEDLRAVPVAAQAIPVAFAESSP